MINRKIFVNRAPGLQSLSVTVRRCQCVCVRCDKYVVLADVERFVDDDPRDSLLAAGLSQRAVVRDVVVSLRHQTLDRDVPHARLLTCNDKYRLPQSDPRDALPHRAAQRSGWMLSG